MNTPGGVVMDYELRDLAGLMLEHAQVVMQKAPANGYGAQAGEREWTLFTDELIREVG
jgi:hypothetical protein